MILDDRIVLGGFGVMAGAISFLWRHSVKAEKKCREELGDMWRMIGSLTNSAVRRSGRHRKLVLPTDMKK